MKFLSSILATCLLCSIAHADQAQDDAALAEQLFERKRLAGEIFEWAQDRAEAAVRNSSEYRFRQAEIVAFTEQCLDEVAGDDAAIREMYAGECEDAANQQIQPLDRDIVAELRRHFIRERFKQEQGAMEEEVLDDLRRRLLGSGQAI